MKLIDFLKAKAIDRSARQPVYEQLAAIIEEAITRGCLSSGDRLPTTRELCEIFELNHLTVRQAIKHLEAAGAIVVKPGRGAFVPSKEEKVRKVLLMLPTLGDDLCAGISRGVRSVLEQDGFDIYVLDYNADAETEKAYLQKISDEGYAGAILYPTLAEESTRLILKFLVDGFPIVLLDREFSGVPGWYVLSDNFQGGYLAGKHLLEQGCKELACVMNKYPNVQERLLGFQTAIMEAGLTLKKSRICFTEKEGDPEGGCTGQLLKTEPGIDGIFYHNDFQALYGYKKIKAAGLSIPGQVKIVGFDDMQAAQFADPELTSIHQYPEQLGQEAANMLLEQLALPATERFRKKEVVVPVQLIVRESSQ
jgi:LacI family transcriptional regulator